MEEKTKPKEEEQNEKLPRYLEAFDIFKKKIEQAENTTFQTFLDKIRNQKKN